MNSQNKKKGNAQLCFYSQGDISREKK